MEAWLWNMFYTKTCFKGFLLWSTFVWSPELCYVCLRFGVKCKHLTDILIHFLYIIILAFVTIKLIMFSSIWLSRYIVIWSVKEWCFGSWFRLGRCNNTQYYISALPMGWTRREEDKPFYIPMPKGIKWWPNPLFCILSFLFL